MDVDIPEIPSRYDAYRQGLREFIAANLPQLAFKQRSGLRAPEDPEDVAKLRRWVRSLHDAGYGADRDDPFEARISVEELDRTRVPYVLGNPLVVGAIVHFGTERQRAAYLPAIASGEHIWTQLFSEPDAGSDLTSLKTRAVLDGDCYVVSGQKVWSTWAQFSDFGYLLARIGSGTGRDGITAFILDMDSEGVTTRPLREITGTTDFNEVFLDSVRIPADNMIGEPGSGWKVAQASLAHERGTLPGEKERDLAGVLVRVARDHRRRGRPAIEDGAVRQQIGRVAARNRMERYLGHQIETRAAKGQTNVWDAPLVKIWFSELNLEVADYALRLLGGRGALVEGEPLAYQDGYLQDAFLYARSWTIAGGSNEILRNVIGERGLELPREPRGDR
ncbi:MAG: acyl-CoA dehydrogenase family protein [bacterium]|nr:acyl-CoA dehydrogenase family protein [bacterium]MCY4193850.1 acyl-CoA dehydrogenase family protein [bacterium]